MAPCAEDGPIFGPCPPAGNRVPPLGKPASSKAGLPRIKGFCGRKRNLFPGAPLPFFGGCPCPSPLGKIFFREKFCLLIGFKPDFSGEIFPFLQVKTIFSGKNSLPSKVETDFFHRKNFLSCRRPLRRFPSVRRALSLPFGTRGFPCFSWLPLGIPQGCRRKGITSFWPVLKQCLSPYRFNGQARRFIE